MVKTDNVATSERVSQKRKPSCTCKTHSYDRIHLVHRVEYMKNHAQKKQNNASPSNQNRPPVCCPIRYKVRSPRVLGEAYEME